MLHEVIQRGVDEEFVAAHTNGFEEVLARVATTRRRWSSALWHPGRAHPAPRRALDPGPRTMLLHARGIEHRTHGVDNCLACINLALATGKSASRAAATR